MSRHPVHSPLIAGLVGNPVEPLFPKKSGRPKRHSTPAQMAEQDDRIIALVKVKKAVSRRDVADLLSIHEVYASQRLRRLVELGRLVRVGHTNRARYLLPPV